MRIASEQGEPCSFTPEDMERISLGKQLEDLVLRARHNLSKIKMAEAKRFWEQHRAKLDCLGPQFSVLEEERMNIIIKTLGGSGDSTRLEGMSTL